MCLDKHYLGMSNPDLYLPSSVKKISTSSTYSVYFHPGSLQSILPFVSCLYFDAESGDRREVGRVQGDMDI